MFDSEIIWSLLLLLLYLIFGRRKKRRKKTGAQPTQSFEDVMREMAAAAAGEVPHATTSAPETAQLEASQTSPVGFLTPKPVFEETPPGHIKELPEQSISRSRSNPQAASIREQLRNPQNARSAIILSEVLGKPHALRNRQ